jgi:hypothetical protein
MIAHTVFCLPLLDELLPPPPLLAELPLLSLPPQAATVNAPAAANTAIAVNLDLII